MSIHSLLKYIGKDAYNNSSLSPSSPQLLFNGNNQLNKLFDNHPDAVLKLEVTGKILYANKSVYEIFGYDKKDLEKNGSSYFYNGDRKKRKKYFLRALKGSAQNFQASVFHKNGQLINTDITYIPIANNENEIQYIYLIAKDITVYIEYKEKWSEMKNTLEFTQQAGKIGNWEFDIKENKWYWSEQMFEIFDINDTTNFVSSTEKASNFIHPDDREHFINVYHNAVKNNSDYVINYRIVHKDGSIMYVREQATIMLDERQKPIRFIGTVQDITKENEYEERLQYLACHDQLTGLPNRTFFHREIEALIESSVDREGMFSILYLDLDRLRIINDSLGHVIGDKLIKKFSQRMEGLLNKISKNHLFARIGGGEFGIILWDYHEADVPVQVAKEIIDNLNQPFAVDDFDLFCTTSVGISTFPTDGKTIEELERSANAALYRAKDSGKNNYQIYSSSLNITSFKLHHLDHDLRKSIDNQQLKVYFQPRVDAGTGKMVSAEALIRWEHPVWGIVPPSDFIPLAEETGFIINIGDWVLEQVCHFFKKWKEENRNIVPISINISAQRFLRNDWKSTIINILEETNTDPALIELEITETTLIKYEQAVEQAFQFLKGLGITIALDDFGTGYSSLSYINNLSIDTIKIDKSFIEQIGKTENVEIIIKSLIFMARGLKMNVVAEGVETPEQLTFLKQQECHEIQGYIYSKPVPVEKFQGLLKRTVLNPIYRTAHHVITERRKYFQIDLAFPLVAHMSLTSIRGKKVELGKTEVIIENIGPGGLRFLSNIHLPVRPDVILQFETEIMGQTITQIGHITWKSEIKNFYQYGLEFKMEERDRDEFIKILNDFSLQLRNNPFVPNCSLIKEDRFSYLRKMNLVH